MALVSKSAKSLRLEVRQNQGIYCPESYLSCYCFSLIGNLKVLSQIGQLCFCLNSSVLWVSFRYLPINKALFTYGVGFTNIELSVSSLTGTRYLHILEMSSLVKFSTSIDVFLIVPLSVLSLDMVGDCSHTLCVSDFLW